MLPKARERLVVELLTRLHRYVRDSDAAAPIASYFEAYDPLSTGAVSIPAFRNALSSFRAPQFCLSTNDMQILAAHYSFGGDPSMISYLSLLDDMSKTPHHLEASWRKASASTKGSSSLIRLEKLERLRGELCMLQQKKLAIIAGLALQASLCQRLGVNASELSGAPHSQLPGLFNSASKPSELNPSTLRPCSRQAKQGVRAYHSAIGEPPGSLAFTQMSGKRRDEVHTGCKPEPKPKPKPPRKPKPKPTPKHKHKPKPSPNPDEVRKAYNEAIKVAESQARLVG